MPTLAALFLQSILFVPGEYPTPQLAIDAAQGGDLVVLSGGTYRGGLTISKSLTIHAIPRARIERDGCAAATVVLKGNNAQVTLSNLDIGLESLGYGGSSCNLRPAIKSMGSGRLKSLTLIKTQALATEHSYNNGQTPGHPGVDVDCDLVHVIDSHIRASECTGGDTGGFWFLQSSPGLLTTGDVLVDGGLIEGGRRDAETRGSWLPEGFSPRTAPGIHAGGEVFWRDGVVKSGRPGTIFNVPFDPLFDEGLLDYGPAVVSGSTWISMETAGF